MTEDQVIKWQKRRNEAKAIEDPKAREAALDVVYDLKDDMQLDCQRKMADRIKQLVENDKAQATEMVGIKTDVALIKTKVETHDPVVTAVRDAQLKAQGGWQLLKLLGWIAAAGGSGAVGFLLALARKASGE